MKRNQELYRINEDPNETNNLAVQNLAIVDELKAELIAFPRGKSVHDPFWKFFY